MKLRLIRHATLQIELAGQHLLVDPLFAETGTYRSLTIGISAERNPIVPLPCSIDTLMQTDIVLVTHSHFDHFDEVAKLRLPKELPMICQYNDLTSLRRSGFTHLIPTISSPIKVNDLEFFRTEGRHGRGLMGYMMGHVSGCIIKAHKEPLLYIAGDTLWGPMVKSVLEQFHPEIIVVNAGAAQFNIGSPITMTAEDVSQVCRAAPDSKVIAVHMDAINHCRLKRHMLEDFVKEFRLTSQVIIPADGELITY